MNCCWCRLQEPFTDASSLLNAAFKLDLVLKRNGFLFWELKALSYYKTPIHKEIDTTLFLYASKHYAQQAPVDGLGKTCSMYHVRRCFDTEVKRSRDWTTDCPVIEMSSILWRSKCTVMPLTSTMEAKILFLNQFWPALALLHNKNNISLSTKLYLSQEACWEETVVPSKARAATRSDPSSNSRQMVSCLQVTNDKRVSFEGMGRVFWSVFKWERYVRSWF